MNNDTDRERIAELQGKFGQYSGKGVLLRDYDGVYVTGGITRRIEVLVRKDRRGEECCLNLVHLNVKHLYQFG